MTHPGVKFRLLLNIQQHNIILNLDECSNMQSDPAPLDQICFSDASGSAPSVTVGTPSVLASTSSISTANTDAPSTHDLHASPITTRVAFHQNTQLLHRSMVDTFSHSRSSSSSSREEKRPVRLV